jgi:cytochrome c peroxidase
MHNGQFQTLEEVIDHYATGGFPASNTNPLMIPFTISDEDKADLIAFIKTFTDMDFVNNPELQNPFE